MSFLLNETHRRLPLTTSPGGRKFSRSCTVTEGRRPKSRGNRDRGGTRESRQRERERQREGQRERERVRERDGESERELETESERQREIRRERK